MARYDKYDPISGGFRAPLEADWPTASEGVPTGVGLSVNGRVVAGVGDTGVLGVLVVDKGNNGNPKKLAGDPVDVMTDGEIVDCTGLASGTVYTAADDGTIAADDGTTGTRVGTTVEAARLVVRAARS